MQWLEHKVPPPIIGALVGLGMWWVAPLSPTLSVGVEARFAAVAVFVAVGLAFDLLGLLAFRASRTTVNPLTPERASALVTSGVYRVTRNPMYVGLFCLLLAWAAYLSALLSLAGPIVYALYVTRFQILPEERALHLLFGELYAIYTASVPRWV
ncbi:MAG: methyltransferase family protein [Thiotrichales bacterium]